MANFVVINLERNAGGGGSYKFTLRPLGEGRFIVGYGVEHRVVSYPWQDNVERSGAPQGLTLTENVFTFHLFIVWSFSHTFKIAMESGDQVIYEIDGKGMALAGCHVEDENGHVIRSYV
jgi:hypothetical protein